MSYYVKSQEIFPELPLEYAIKMKDLFLRSELCAGVGRCRGLRNTCYKFI